MNAMHVREMLESLSAVDRTRELIRLLEDDPLFDDAARDASSELERRDQLDEHALAAGIEYAQRNGILSSSVDDHLWHLISVDGLTPAELARIISRMADEMERSPRSIAVSGSSGIGKGTTVEALSAVRHGCWTWSSGDVFRFITYITSRTIGPDLHESHRDLETTVRRVAESITFQPNRGVLGRLDGQEIEIGGIPSPELRSVAVSSKVPLVARYSQGDVIRLANAAFRVQPPDSCMVIEGRKTTLNFVHADLHIELTMADTASIGARRVAQRLDELLAQVQPRPDERLDEFFRREYR